MLERGVPAAISGLGKVSSRVELKEQNVFSLLKKKLRCNWIAAKQASFPSVRENTRCERAW